MYLSNKRPYDNRYLSLLRWLQKISLSALLFELPLKLETHFSDEQGQKLLSLYKTMFVERALRSKG